MDSYAASGGIFSGNGSVAVLKSEKTTNAYVNDGAVINAVKSLNIGANSHSDNQAYAELNGLESVVSTAYSKWKTIYEHGDPEYMSITGLSDYISLLQNSEDKLILITCSTLTDGDASLKAAFEERKVKRVLPAVSGKHSDQYRQ